VRKSMLRDKQGACLSVLTAGKISSRKLISCAASTMRMWCISRSTLKRATRCDWQSLLATSLLLLLLPVKPGWEVGATAAAPVQCSVPFPAVSVRASLLSMCCTPWAGIIGVAAAIT